MSPLPRHVFASRMKEVRDHLGVSQAAVAKYLTERLDYTVDSSAISRIEAADRLVRLDEAVLVAESLQVPLSELLNARGSGLQARIDDVRFSLKGAQAALDAARTEVEHRHDKVEELSIELEELEDQERAEEKAETEKDLLHDLNTKLWPH